MTKLIFHNQNSLTIKLPMLIDVDDYHEFEHIQKVLSRMSGKTVKVKELTNKYIAEKYAEKDKHFNYLGLVYSGKFPTDKEILSLTINSLI